MTEHNTSPPHDGSNTNKSKKRTPRKQPLSLHPLTVDEALAISLGAGPLPEKTGKRAKKSARKRQKAGDKQDAATAEQ